MTELQVFMEFMTTSSSRATQAPNVGTKHVIVQLTAMENALGSSKIALTIMGPAVSMHLGQTGT